MALENTDFQDQLAQAPPQAPTAADVEANKAAADSAAAQSLANAASNRAGTNLAVSPKAHPYGIVPNEEDVTASDIGQKASPVAPYNPSAPAPGSLGYHLMKAFSTPAAKEPGGGVKALFSGVTDALLGKPLNDALAANQPRPVRPPPPETAPTTGSWGSALSNEDATKSTTPPLTAPRRAIGAPILDQLGDAAAAAGPGGLAGGFARAAAAGGQRSREEMNDRRLMATANAQMLHEQALVHKMGEDEINSSIAESAKQMETLLTPVPNAPPEAAGKKVAEGKTSDELNQMIKSGELRPSEETVFASGRIQTGKDANGIPQFRTTYTVIKPAKEVTLTKENADFLNTNLGLKGSEAYSEGQVLPGTDANGEFQKADSANITKRAFDVDQAKANIVLRGDQVAKDSQTIFSNPVVTNALQANKAGEDDPYAVLKAFDAIMTNPSLRNDPRLPPNFADAYKRAYVGSENTAAQWDKQEEAYHKAQAKNQDTVDAMLDKASSDPKEIEGHTPAFTAAMKSIIADPDASPEKKKKAMDVLATVQDVRQGEIDLEKAKAEGKKEAAVGYEGDPNATSPEAFFKSLKPEEQALVKLIGTGQAGMTRLEYLAARKDEVLQAVARAFPDFDQSKVVKYIEASKDFAAKKVADQMLSGGAVLQHLQEARDLNTNASHIYGTPAYNAYKNKIDTLAGELGKFYGDATVPAIEGYKSTLMATLPGNREAAILTQARSMVDRLTGYVTRWKNAAPSKVYEAKMPWISPEAQHAISKLNPQFSQDYPELVSGAAGTPLAKREQAQNQPSPSAGPAGGTHPMVSQDGKTNIWLLNNQWVTADGKPYRP